MGNNPINYIDPTGHWAESAWDAFSLGTSLDDFIRKPSLLNGLWVAADAVSLAVPFMPAFSMLWRSDDLAKLGSRLLTDQTGSWRPFGGGLVPSDAISFDRSQIQSKFKHANDFGITSNWSPGNGDKFVAAMKSFVDSDTTKAIRGSYRGEDVIHYVNPNSGLWVGTDLKGNFVSGWKLNPEQLRNVLERGSL